MLNLTKNFLNTNKFLWFICLLAVGSFFLTLNLPVIGEEGVYTNSTLEMIFNKKYTLATLYGNNYPRPPLYNWLIMLFSNVFSCKNIMFSARAVTLTATIIMAILLFYTTKFLTVNNIISQTNKKTPQQNTFALFTVAVFFSGDLLFKRGWLAYSDPTFAMFVFASMALLVAGTIKRNFYLIFLAHGCVFLGFLCKSPTAYVFFTITYLILLFSEYKNFLLNLKNILLCAIFIAPPVLWCCHTNNAAGFFATLYHIQRLQGVKPNPEANLLRNIIFFPIQTWLALLPGSLMIFWGVLKNKAVLKQQLTTQTIINPKIITIISLISLINFIPYWISSQSHIRYLLPLYPWVALLVAYFIWQTKSTRKTLVLLMLTIIIKYLTATLWFPYEYNINQGNAAIISQDILQKTLNHDLYIQDYSAAGLRLANTINQLKWPAQPLQSNPKNNKNYYFILKEHSPVNKQHMRLIKTYILKKNKIDLYLCSNQNIPPQTTS